ncbi:MAG: hypothetical protein IPG17_18145 [Sandaracinaceae bacterium]|jgi:hypothetical protein|nr:hypothetical protein [Sandaracinaceae bacterium]MBP7682759.1 hypothetical protein [Deltaproteobacteria bacterium]MBK7156856.1 hypothetical protein [Sandaracinaceae bacterium]MBK7777506.1 hypothetical protein [Sandaracinaceae bacterium]MBK8410083.1 hypothetical protein [Sandaracinaceae bacterium]
MTTRVDLRCQCGAVRGVANDIAPHTGMHIVCMCDDCQAFAHFLERDDVLDASGGTAIFQVRPPQLSITTGGEHLRCVRLSEKGMLRWYAGCCRTPIANTMASARAPFAGVITAFIVPEAGASKEAVLGPVIARLMAKFARGAAPAGSHATMPAWLMLRTLRFLLGGFLRGKASPSPFFDARTRQPVVTPQVLSEAERSALRRV